MRGHPSVVGLWIFANYTFLKRIHGKGGHNQVPTEWPPKAWQPSPEEAEKLEKQEVPIAAEFAKVLGENVLLPSPPPAHHRPLPSHSLFPLQVGSSIDSALDFFLCLANLLLDSSSLSPALPCWHRSSPSPIAQSTAPPPYERA
jgi:hypothetical protein